MRKILSIFCIIFLLALALPSHAYEDQEKEEEVVEETEFELDVEHRPQKKSVATAALLSAIPGFGAGLYYAHEYPAAISSTVAQAMGLGLLLDSLLRSHRSSTAVSGITLMGSSWLFGVIYAPISVHQQNKIVEERYSLRPYLDVSHQRLYAGVNCSF